MKFSAIYTLAYRYEKEKKKLLKKRKSWFAKNKHIGDKKEVMSLRAQ